jgi:hypothetical protein
MGTLNIWRSAILVSLAAGGLVPLVSPSFVLAASNEIIQAKPCDSSGSPNGFFRYSGIEVVDQKDAKLRTKPSKSAPVVAILPHGTSLYLDVDQVASHAAPGNWSFVHTGCGTGYVEYDCQGGPCHPM